MKTVCASHARKPSGDDEEHERWQLDLMSQLANVHCKSQRKRKRQRKIRGSQWLGRALLDVALAGQVASEVRFVGEGNVAKVAVKVIVSYDGLLLLTFSGIV